jgi:hypothetical protein
MAAANNYGILYSAFVLNAGNQRQYQFPCAPEILSILDFGRVNYLGVNYIFRKNSAEDFRFPIQGAPAPDKPWLRYRVSYLSDAFPPERYYIPSSAADYGLRFLLKQTIKEVRSKLLRK